MLRYSYHPRYSLRSRHCTLKTELDKLVLSDLESELLKSGTIELLERKIVADQSKWLSLLAISKGDCSTSSSGNLQYPRFEWVSNFVNQGEKYPNIGPKVREEQAGSNKSKLILRWNDARLKATSGYAVVLLRRYLK